MPTSARTAVLRCRNAGWERRQDTVELRLKRRPSQQPIRDLINVGSLNGPADRAHTNERLRAHRSTSPTSAPTDSAFVGKREIEQVSSPIQNSLITLRVLQNLGTPEPACTVVDEPLDFVIRHSRERGHESGSERQIFDVGWRRKRHASSYRVGER